MKDVTVYEILTERMGKHQQQATKLVPIAQDHAESILETGVAHVVLVQSCQRFSMLGKRGEERRFKVVGVPALTWLRLHSAAPVYVAA